MTIELKDYQKNALKKISEYLDDCRFENPQDAFKRVAASEGDALKKEYFKIENLEDVPYVCLRLPTGGGKTFLAAHCVKTASERYLERDYPFVLWMVPTNTIRKQTIKTLRDPGHHHYDVLQKAFDGKFEVLDVDDFERIRPRDLSEKACIIVGTMASFRVDDTGIRKVYAHNENLESHFFRIPPGINGLEKMDDGGGRPEQIKFSFCNLLALHRPLVIVDEAHNASTPLSFEVLQRIRPSCIVEFTATPASQSNILYRVSASELKAEHMIKLPIILTEHQNWQDAIHDSILKRNELSKLSADEEEYIRPVILIQAEDKGQDVTVEVVEQYLKEQESIDPAKIAVVTGERKELDDVNILDKASLIEIVITKQALKEGWDCPFAYVFCSVATVHSKQAVEQLLGRVLRMPYAKKRNHESLNKAYANVSSSSWPNAVGQIHDRLVDMGFEHQEADQYVQHNKQYDWPLFNQDNNPPIAEPLDIEVTTKVDFSDLPDDVGKNVQYREEFGKKIVTIAGILEESVKKKIVALVNEDERAHAKEAIKKHQLQAAIRLSPAESGQAFKVPRLCVEIQGELELSDKEWFIDPRGWNLMDFPVEISEEEFSIQEKSNSYLIDIQGKRLIQQHLGQAELFDFNMAKSGWDVLILSRWLDARLFQKDVRQEVLLEYLRRTVVYLVEKRRIPFEALVRARFALQKVLEFKIKNLRKKAYDRGYQETLFGENSVARTSFEYAFKFNPENYPAKFPYQGMYVFNNHYYKYPGELKSEGEEFECAKVIDQHPKVKCWVRNLERQQEYSFSLPTSTDLFYPDFVCLLNDRRIFVVEYKGEQYRTNDDSKEKNNIGQLWEEKSGGKALFLMLTDVKGKSLFGQIDAKIQINSENKQRNK